MGSWRGSANARRPAYAATTMLPPSAARELLVQPRARAAAEWTRTRCRTRRAVVAAQPVTRVVDEILLVHGSPRDPLREYVTDEDVAEENMAIQPTQHALHGHTHVPVAWMATPGHVALVEGRDSGGVELGAYRTLINPGSVDSRETATRAPPTSSLIDRGA